jgi:hypothetical protein
MGGRNNTMRIPVIGLTVHLSAARHYRTMEGDQPSVGENHAEDRCRERCCISDSLDAACGSGRMWLAEVH